MNYMVDINKLYAFYRINVNLSKHAAEVIMSGMDYTKPVVILDKPQPGLSLIQQGSFKAVVPDQVLTHVAD